MKVLKHIVFIVIICVQSSFCQELLVSEKQSKYSFPLIYPKGNATLYIDRSEEKVIHIAAGELIKDIVAVTDQKIHLVHSQPSKSNNVIIAGTIGSSEWIDKLIASKKVDVSDIEGKWEAFKIVQISNLSKGINKALVVIGSDRRATAFGLFEISRKIGVSPFYWWADIVPTKKKALYLSVNQDI
ncbi:hypothetical protein EIM50_18910, partial [Pseudoxanthomonas sp. SGD-10]